jgi:hypothetical protein
VKLKVEFTFPFLKILCGSLEILKELVASGKFDFRSPLKILKSLEPFNVFNLRATTAIAISEKH